MSTMSCSGGSSPLSLVSAPVVVAVSLLVVVPETSLVSSPLEPLLAAVSAVVAALSVSLSALPPAQADVRAAMRTAAEVRAYASMARMLAVRLGERNSAEVIVGGLEPATMGAYAEPKDRRVQTVSTR